MTSVPLACSLKRKRFSPGVTRLPVRSFYLMESKSGWLVRSSEPFIIRLELMPTNIHMIRKRRSRGMTSVGDNHGKLRAILVMRFRRSQDPLVQRVV